MMAKIPSSISAPGNPPKEGTPAPVPSFNDQMQIMQSLLEIHKELATLNTKTERVILDVGKLDDHVDKIRGKMQWVQGIAICAAVLLTIFGGFVWWLIGGQLTQLKDQLYTYQQKIDEAAETTPK